MHRLSNDWRKAESTQRLNQAETWGPCKRQTRQTRGIAFRRERARRGPAATDTRAKCLPPRGLRGISRACEVSCFCQLKDSHSLRHPSSGWRPRLDSRRAASRMRSAHDSEVVR